MASRIPDFMSKTPGPRARPASTLNPRFAISPAGHTVSVCPSSRMRSGRGSRELHAQVVAEFFGRNNVDLGAGLLEFAVKLFSEKRDKSIGESFVETRGLHRNHLFQQP